MTGRRCYSVYGAILASALPLPELDEIPSGPARWTVDVATALPPMERAAELGADLIWGDVHARLFTHAGGYRIVVEDTGAFDLSADRSHVTVVPKDGASPDFVRAHLTGRVLATLLHLDGLLPLHGSAVVTREGAIGFLAPKGFGKSSLALALAHAGAWLMSDDTLPILPDSAEASPGVHGLRVHDDALEAVGVEGGSLRTREGKHVLRHIGAERVTARPRSLAALYLLAPVEPDGEGVDRVLLPPSLAAISIVAHVKIGGMLGGAAAAELLARAARVAERVPVFQLRTPRDLASLSATAATLLEWHGLPST
jgi:hypothetical protein